MNIMYRTLRLILFVFAFSLLAYKSVLADEDISAQTWIERMSAAIKSLNYEGTFVYIHDKQIETMRIFHSNDNGVEKERLFSLAGESREILRNNDQLICILPESQSVVVEKSRPKTYLPEGLQHVTSNLKRYYEFTVVGDARMTGRQAKLVQVRPNDLYRYGYNLWIDKQTAMLLKSDLVNELGEPVEQFMFTDIKILDAIPVDSLKPTINSEGYKTFKQAEVAQPSSLQATQTGKQSKWKVTRLPEGYMKGMHKTHGLPTSRMPVEHLMFTDGISSVSVYIEEMNEGNPMARGFSRMGAVNAYTTIVSKHYITVVGEVPKAAVKMIGDYVRYAPGP